MNKVLKELKDWLLLQLTIFITLIISYVVVKSEKMINFRSLIENIIQNILNVAAATF